jgi:hypothetical protein
VFATRELAALLSIGDSKHKSVSFELDEENQPIERVFTYPRVPQEMHGDVYWTKKDLRQSYFIQKQLVKEQMKATPELADCIYTLHGYSKKKQGDEQLMADVRTDTETEAAKIILAQSGCRGLEEYMTPLIVKHREWAINKLLEIQEQCRDQGPTQLEFALHVWSTRVGGASNRFAKHVADCDEEAACQMRSVHRQRQRSSFIDRTNSTESLCSVDSGVGVSRTNSTDSIVSRAA